MIVGKVLDLLLGQLFYLADQNAGVKSLQRLAAIPHFAQNGCALGSDPQFHSLAEFYWQRDPDPRARNVHDGAVYRASSACQDLDFGLVIGGIASLPPALGSLVFG